MQDETDADKSVRVGHHILSTETLYFWEGDGVTEKHFNEW